MKTGLGPAPGDVGIDVHDEHGASLARENVQVIDEQLAALGSERCIEVMGHETLRSLVLLVIHVVARRARMQHAGGTPCGCAVWPVPTWFILSWALSAPEASDDGDLAVAVTYGDPVRDVARDIQRHIIATLRESIGLQTITVNVTVDDILTGDDQ